jgi:hypothetical protein
MTYARAAATTFAAFLASQIFAIVIHGFILAGDYAPFYGNLLRDQNAGPEPQALLLPVAHLSFTCALVWIYSRLSIEGSHVVRGLKLGVAAWAAGQAPLYMLWYAEQPWPGELLVKQLGLELIASLAIGLTIALVGRQPEGRPLRAAATTGA